jgi:hypothetical protein
MNFNQKTKHKFVNRFIIVNVQKIFKAAREKEGLE